MLARLKRFDAKLDEKELDAMLVTGQNNIYYLTGFWGTAATVFISKTRRLFVTDARYTLVAKQTVQGLISSKAEMSSGIAKVLRRCDSTIGLIACVSFAYYQTLQGCFAVMIW